MSIPSATSVAGGFQCSDQPDLAHVPASQDKGAIIFIFIFLMFIYWGGGGAETDGDTESEAASRL